MLTSDDIETTEPVDNSEANSSVQNVENLNVEKKIKKKKQTKPAVSVVSVNYHGVNIFQAAGEGNLPLCVLLWGIASAKRVNLMSCDALGNNPMHFAAFAESPEVNGGCVTVSIIGVDDVASGDWVFNATNQGILHRDTKIGGYSK